QAERDGADGILVLPPYYAHPDPDGLVGYYRQIAEATALGVAIYARDGVALTPALLERLAREIPNLVAFKDGRGDVRLFQRLREHAGERLGAERLVWLAGAGDDMVGPYFAAGAEGFTSSLACFWREASLELYCLTRAADYRRLAQFHEHVVRPFYDLRQRRLGFQAAVLKVAMQLPGHPAGPVRPPLGEPRADEREQRRLVRPQRPPSRDGAKPLGRGHPVKSAERVPHDAPFREHPRRPGEGGKRREPHVVRRRPRASQHVRLRHDEGRRRGVHARRGARPRAVRDPRECRRARRDHDGAVRRAEPRGAHAPRRCRAAPRARWRPRRG